MSTNHFLPELAIRLNQALSNAYFSPSPEKAVQWMENAYAANEFRLNLNKLHRTLLSAAGNNQKTIGAAFESVVAQVLVHDIRNREQYLETLWHFVSDGDEKRLFRLCEQVSSQLVDAKPIDPHSLNPKHWMILYLLVDGDAHAKLGYRTKFAKLMYIDQDSKPIQECLDLMLSLKPESYYDLGNAYTAVHMDLNMTFNGDDEELNLLGKLFPSPLHRINHVNAALKRELLMLKNLFAHDHHNGPENFLNAEPQQRINHILRLIGHALTPETQPIFLQNFTDSLRSAYSQDLSQVGDIAHPKYEKPIQDTYNRLHQLSQGMEALNIPWRDAFRQSFNQAEEKSPKTINTRSPLLKLVALIALDELSAEQLAQQFPGNITLLTCLYKLTHNTEFLPYLDGKSRHACIEHDMGL